jgi:hypothetical protein
MADNLTIEQEQLLAVAREGLQDIGYRNGLLREQYDFADPLAFVEGVRRIELAAFAQEPTSYRTACFGVTVPAHYGPTAIQPYWALGAPQILALHPATQEIRVWKIRAQGAPELVDQIPSTEFAATIRERAAIWNPAQVHRAKIAAFPGYPRQLDFFDSSLIPVLEGAVYRKLDSLLRAVIAACKQVYIEHHDREPDYVALFRLVFRLIAGKFLGDRQQAGDWNKVDAQTTVEMVEAFYFHGADLEPVLDDPEVQRIAWDHIRTAFHFQNISSEALAYVYENTLVNTETRKQYDIHATPPEIAEYIMRSLPLETLDLEDRRIFEPFAGHAPFLIASLVRLRALVPQAWTAQECHTYLVRMLQGMEIDSFAREVALYSLNISDYPNPNGWQIANADFFSASITAVFLRNAHIVLCNPPYGRFTAEEQAANPTITSGSKTVEALRRILEHPPKMLGLVLPRVFATGQEYRAIRRQIDSLYNNISLVVLPDVAFHHSEAETVILLAHGTRTDHPQHRFALVPKEKYPESLHTDSLDWSTGLSLPSGTQTDIIFQINPLQDVWAELESLPRLGDVAEIHRGIEYKVSVRENTDQLFSDTPKPGFAPGLRRVTKGFEPYVITDVQYLNMDPNLMLYDAYKLPWEQPKVIVNAARLSRSPWAIAAGIDERGLVCYQRFHGIWPRRDLPIEVIAALLNGPVANAFVSGERDIQVGRLRAVPVPHFSSDQRQAIVSLVRQYRFYREQWLAHSTDVSQFERTCREIIEKIDATVLEAYALQPALHRKLTAYFAGQKRPGPVRFDLIPSPAVPNRSLYGLWADLGSAPSAEEIDQARREAWANFTISDSP